ncbi:sugar ABC transporter permease [Paenibacillus melissococcoides]|uniref:Sugar ABC transporter permease n=1 Tax=Paenibacillus melissococcoides TaxID=2912268 RepID=A0ABN8UBW9_9BACL|nr:MULTISPECIES: sugar ABC transporter permease [Paenibacillus]MEB9896071.1 sugar ABC transporter permease [Bacillus cereus]CAH8247317.1 sugar ABC transporter permease [Paenibacillus melissococcoides]CAH8717351.1 sugar ABC transporter permease [Paenibacillus melissococcoides]CAH8718338.1 sugar ABC transporter permease [Paenibacillus melissococcoides]GIO77884.1 sugar ABC transporter permease [Paenibacillus dendritiformis]
MQRTTRRMTALPRQAAIPYLFIMPWIIGFLAFTLGPLVFSLVISFYEWPIVGEKTFVGIANYVEMFRGDPLFWTSLGVTLKFAALFVPLNIGVALLLAILLNQRVRGSGFFRSAFYLPSVISGVALAMIWSWVFDGEYGILNYLLSIFGIEGPNWLNDPTWAPVAMVIASLWGQGTMMLIFLAGLKNIPKDLYEVSAIDGAGRWTQFVRITLPMLSPTILFNLITTIIAAFQQLTLALVMTGGGPLNSTYFYAMYMYENAFKYSKMGYASANAWFMFIIVLLLTALVFRSSSAWVYYEGEMRKDK